MRPPVHTVVPQVCEMNEAAILRAARGVPGGVLRSRNRFRPVNLPAPALPVPAPAPPPALPASSIPLQPGFSLGRPVTTNIFLAQFAVLASAHLPQQSSPSRQAWAPPPPQPDFLLARPIADCLFIAQFAAFASAPPVQPSSPSREAWADARRRWSTSFVVHALGSVALARGDTGLEGALSEEEEPQVQQGSTSGGEFLHFEDNASMEEEDDDDATPDGAEIWAAAADESVLWEARDAQTAAAANSESRDEVVPGEPMDEDQVEAPLADVPSLDNVEGGPLASTGAPVRRPPPARSGLHAFLNPRAGLPYLARRRAFRPVLDTPQAANAHAEYRAHLLGQNTRTASAPNRFAFARPPSVRPPSVPLLASSYMGARSRRVPPPALAKQHKGSELSIDELGTLVREHYRQQVITLAEDNDRANARVRAEEALPSFQSAMFHARWDRAPTVHADFLEYLAQREESADRGLHPELIAQWHHRPLELEDDPISDRGVESPRHSSAAPSLTMGSGVEEYQVTREETPVDEDDDVEILPPIQTEYDSESDRMLPPQGRTATSPIRMQGGAPMTPATSVTFTAPTGTTPQAASSRATLDYMNSAPAARFDGDWNFGWITSIISPSIPTGGGRLASSQDPSHLQSAPMTTATSAA
jgi:hypothetical protein